MKHYLASLVCFFTALPALVFAQRDSGAPSIPRDNGAPPTTPGNGGAQGDLKYSLQNPLAFDSIQGFIVAILNIIIVIATPIVVIFIILAGFKYVTARGDASKVQEATRALTYSVIGGVLIIGAVAIAEIIKNLITSFGT